MRARTLNSDLTSLGLRVLLDDGLKGGNSESPERASLFFAFLSVCLSVTKLQVTVFDPAWENRFSIFFIFDVFRAFFSFSSLSLYWPQATPLDLQPYFLASWFNVT